MDIEIKSEPIDITSDNEDDQNIEIKEERELIIDTEWYPKKFEDEEKEYYQEFVGHQNVRHEIIVKSEGSCEYFTAEYIDENEDYGDDEYENDDCDDYEDFYDYENYYDYEKDDEENLVGCTNKKNDEAMSNDLESKVLYQMELNKWIAENYIYRECPVCCEKFVNYSDLQRHIIVNHKSSIEESESNYYFSSDNCGVCKKCNHEFVTQFSRYAHSVKHSEDDTKLGNICKLCNFISTRIVLQKHIHEKHPHVVKEFKISGSLRKLKCPVCSNLYRRRNQLWYHFLDKHPHEYKEKLCYKCHLCEHVLFNEETIFFQHLIDHHELNSWKVLNYRKIFEDKEYIACKKCNTLFFQNDIYKLLKHFSSHSNDFVWSCKFCSKNINFKKFHVSHMCVKMVRYYEKLYEKGIAYKIQKNPAKTGWNIKNLQEFEEHVTHVCPFCNKNFGQMLKWQHHLRTNHKIDTLKGLQMKVVSHESNKLSCVICHTLVANSPEQLHAHRFQHLPYKPYKCLICSTTLSTFKIAVNHIFKSCNDEEESSIIGKDDYDTRSLIEIQCCFCNNRKFPHFESILEHYKTEHDYFEEFFIQHSDNSMTCKVCQRKYVLYGKKSCFEHLHHHFEEKTFKCKLCFRSYRLSRTIHQHFLNLHNAKPITNPLNDKSNKKDISEEKEISHVKKIPQLAKASIKSHVLNEFAEFISYACPECNEGMTTQQNWHNHIRTQHNFFDETNLYIKDTDGSLKCPLCNMNVDTRILQQQKHKLTHMPYRSFMCNLCYTRCNSLGILYGHFRRRHFAQGSFGCPICAKVLNTEHQRVEHLKKQHPRKEWPLNMCLICYKILSTKSSLTKHMETHDADRFKYSCDICGSKVVALRDYTIHMDRHKMRGEVKENVSDEDTTPSASEINHLNKIEHTDSSDIQESMGRNFNKRNCQTKGSVTKKKKSDAV